MDILMPSVQVLGYIHWMVSISGLSIIRQHPPNPYSVQMFETFKEARRFKGFSIHALGVEVWRVEVHEVFISYSSQGFREISTDEDHAVKFLMPVSDNGIHGIWMNAGSSNMKGRVELTFPIEPYQYVHACSGEEQKVPRFLVRIKPISNSVIKVIVLLQCFPQRPVF